MKDIPVFTTTAGAATLILRNIPAWGRAYILPCTGVTSAFELAQQCAGFCRAAGAREVDIRLPEPEPGLPFRCELWRLRLEPERRPGGERLRLTPVTARNAEDYRALYNRRFAGVDNAAVCGAEDLQRLQAGGGYLYYEGEEAVGLGEVQDGELRAIASARRGLGEPLALSLLEKIPGPVELTVASSNLPALQLYERLGFEKVRRLSSWYRVP